MLGWLFGVAHFTFGNNWIATAFTHQAEMPAVLGWAAVPLLSLYLALYPALAALGARALAGTRQAVGARARVRRVLDLVRDAARAGLHRLRLEPVRDGPARPVRPARASPRWRRGWALTRCPASRCSSPPRCAALVRERRLVVAAAGRGAARGRACTCPRRAAREGTVRFTLVQPDLTQDRLSDPRYYEANFVRLAQLSLPRDAGRASGWCCGPNPASPTTCAPGYPQRYYDRMTALGDPAFARERIGAGDRPEQRAADRRGRSRDRAAAARSAPTTRSPRSTARGAILGGYAKAHLVPYGEYLPMRPLLEPLGLSRLVAGTIDFMPGPGPRTLDLGAHGKAGIQICYEIVFSGEVVERGNRPDYIFNPSNDGWFGAFGPPQHLAQARMRAIEEGLPVLRSTTTGISAVIDARGVVREHFAQLARRADRRHDPAGRRADPVRAARQWLPLAWAMVFLALAAVALRRRPG